MANEHQLSDFKNYISRISNSRFLITGGAGFIGSNLAEFLLANGAKHVRVLDNLSTGYEYNISDHFGKDNFELIIGDITVPADCAKACKDVDIVFHQAALGSITRSVNDPLATHENNATGTLNVFVAARDAKVKRVVYASSSSVYGDSLTLPKVEGQEGNPISPYAVSKLVTEKYAFTFYGLYGFENIGLRYFNVFGPKQNSKGAYAAVIPNFVEKILAGESPVINGDGMQSRDFTYIQNVIQANILAAFTENKDALNNVYNVAFGGATSVKALCEMIIEKAKNQIEITYGPERPGDIRDSLADISKAENLLGYSPDVSMEDGLGLTLDWFKAKLS